MSKDIEREERLPRVLIPRRASETPNCWKRKDREIDVYRYNGRFRLYFRLISRCEWARLLLPSLLHNFTGQK